MFPLAIIALYYLSGIDHIHQLNRHLMIIIIIDDITTHRHTQW